MPISDERVKIIALSLSDKILEEARRTKRTGVEHGFSICKSKRGIEIGERCVGDKCNIDIGECRQTKRIGSFHTHPTQPNWDVFPSPDDVLHSWGTSEEFFCIANKKAQTRCWKVVQAQPGKNRRIKPTFYKFARAYLDGDRDKAMDMILTDDDLGENKIIRQIIRFDAHKVEREMRALED